MSQIGTELLVILLLLLVNGLLAMTEMAVVSARKARLRRLVDQGDQRASAALALAESPNRFLSTVQIGITLVGVLAGAFGGATIAKQITADLEPISVLAPYAEAIGVVVVVVAITYCSLVIGELVPKRLGLAYPERIARVMAGPMNRLATLAAPVVKSCGSSAGAPHRDTWYPMKKYRCSCKRDRRRASFTRPSRKWSKASSHSTVWPCAS
jgi:putative hemolysin